MQILFNELKRDNNLVLLISQKHDSWNAPVIDRDMSFCGESEVGADGYIRRMNE